MASLLTWEYVGGFFDGESCVAWEVRKDRHPVAVLSQKNRMILDLIGEFLRTEDITHFGVYRGTNVTGGYYALRIERPRIH